MRCSTGQGKRVFQQNRPQAVIRANPSGAHMPQARRRASSDGSGVLPLLKVRAPSAYSADYFSRPPSHFQVTTDSAAGTTRMQSIRRYPISQEGLPSRIVTAIPINTIPQAQSKTSFPGCQFLIPTCCVSCYLIAHIRMSRPLFNLEERCLDLARKALGGPYHRGTDALVAPFQPAPPLLLSRIEGSYVV